MPKKKKLLRARVNVEQREGYPPVWKWVQGYTREEIAAAKAEKVRAYAPEAETAPASMLFCDYAEQWFEIYKKTRLRESTRRMYRMILDNYLLPALGDKQLGRITRPQLQLLMNGLAGKSASIIHKVALTAKQIFDSAVDDNLIPRSPYRRIEKPKGSVTPVQPIRPELLPSLTQHCLADPEGLLPLLLLYTGLRKGEAMALQWKDIRDGRVHVSKAVSYPNNNLPVISEPKTAAGVRAVPLVPVLAGRLSNPGKPEEYIFGGASPMTSHVLTRMWSRLQQRIPELDGVHMHQLRHTYTDMLRHAGVSELAAQHYLGHESYSTTLSFYSKFDSMDAKQAENRLLHYLASQNGHPCG